MVQHIAAASWTQLLSPQEQRCRVGRMQYGRLCELMLVILALVWQEVVGDRITGSRSAWMTQCVPG